MSPISIGSANKVKVPSLKLQLNKLKKNLKGRKPDEEKEKEHYLREVEKKSSRNREIKFPSFTNKDSLIYQLRQSMNNIDQYGYQMEQNPDVLATSRHSQLLSNSF